MSKWSKLPIGDKTLLGLACGFIASVVVATIHEAIWPSPEDKEAGQKDKEFKRLKGKILRRARFRCESCGQGRRELEVCYIDKEGECTYDNLRALCSWCKNG